MIDMQDIIGELIEFRKKRFWEEYHTPRNLAESVVIESGELLKCFQWGKKEDKSAIKDEVADIMIYCIYLCESYGFDPAKTIIEKIEKNAKKYPLYKSHKW